MDGAVNSDRMTHAESGAAFVICGVAQATSWIGATVTLRGAFIGNDLIVNIQKKIRGSLAVLVLLPLPSLACAAGFDIRLIFTDGLSASQQSVLSQAESFWERHVAGYRAGIEITELVITAGTADLDGEGGSLALATPQRGIFESGFVLPTAGVLNFDNSDLAALENNGTLFDAVVREMAHVMGFGTMWTFNNVYINGSGLYTGARALAAYRAEFDPDAAFVPVDVIGGAGVANVLWDEAWAGGPNELMTDTIGADTFISRTTLASLEDLGYLLSVPLPATMILVLTVLCFIVVVARRKKFRP